MSEETTDPTKPTKAKTTRGPKPQRLKIQGDWKDAVRKSFTKRVTKRSPK
jgi:hypothetical protein